MRTTTTRPALRALALAAVLALGLTACGWRSVPGLGVQGEHEGAAEEATPAPRATPTDTASPTEAPLTPVPSERDEPWSTVDVGTSPDPEPTRTATSTTEDPEESTADEPTQDQSTDEPTSEPADDAGTGDAPDPRAGAVLEQGDRGEEVARVQQQLADLGYWLGTADGVFGSLTEQAVLAFQGWEGLARDGVVGPTTRDALDEAARPVPSNSGDLVEIHRDRGVLLVVRGGETRWAIHTSTGSGERYTQPDGDVAVADTPAGRWTVSWQVDGWRESFLGELWRPKYFHEHGLAIHGYPEVPAHNASHGCARVSMEAMNLLWDQGLVPKGSTVVVQ